MRDQFHRFAAVLTGSLVLFYGSFGLSGQIGKAHTSQPAGVSSTASVQYVTSEFYVPVHNAYPVGLDVVEVYADLPGRHPLALITHGTSNKKTEREHLTPWALYGPALWFAMRGYSAIIVVRKGYGRSGGKRNDSVGDCKYDRFAESGEASAGDLRDVIQSIAKRPEIDISEVVSVGFSTGGFAQVAFSADPMPTLKAAISFAGGQGGDGNRHNCNLSMLLGAFQRFGKAASKHGKIPMLWVYSENDHWFPPSMAKQFDAAYRGGGGNDQLVIAPAEGSEGHRLFYNVAAWSDIVTAFLKGHDLLPFGDRVLPPPVVPRVPAPAGLNDEGIKAWKRYLGSLPFKAFALAGNGAWGASAVQFDQMLADRQAMENCKKWASSSANSCRVVARTATLK